MWRMTDNIIPVELAEKSTLGKKILPLVLTAAVFAADQLTKWLIVTSIEPYTVGLSLFDGVLRIIHVYNTGAAFSMGHSLSEILRTLLLGIVPLVVLALVLVVYFRSDEFTTFQRWAIAGVVGGGLGNLFDRFFRQDGVVDFIDVKFYGIFGLERWPTFNVADAAICVCGALLIVSFVRAIISERRAEKDKEKK